MGHHKAFEQPRQIVLLRSRCQGAVRWTRYLPGTSLWKKLGWEELEEEFWAVAAGLTSLQGATWIWITLDYDAESGRFIRYPWDYTFLSFPATFSCQKPFVEAWLCRNLPLDFSSEASGSWVRCTSERPPSCLSQQCLLQRAYMVGLSNRASEECDSSFSKSKIFYLSNVHEII